jgi:hypothetical protein
MKTCLIIRIFNYITILNNFMAFMRSRKYLAYKHAIAFEYFGVTVPSSGKMVSSTIK